jgi:Uma2 family endonuclease
MIPARARVTGHSACSSKVIWRGNSDCIALRLILISEQEYLSTTCDSDCEYVDGELIERNRGESEHSTLQGIVCVLLYNRRREPGIYVFPSLHLHVAATRYRIPDITVATQKVRGGILRDPPFLCVEILSPADRFGEMQSKIDDYLAFGVQYVWLIDPHKKKAWSYTNEGKRESSNVLTTTGPRLRVSLDEVFAALEENLEP